MGQNESPPLPIEFVSCDTCRHGDRQPDGNVVCFGAPPTVVIIGVRQSALAGGSPQFQCEMLRPVMKPGSRGCGQHESSIALLRA